MSQTEGFLPASSDMDSEFDKPSELREIKRRNRLNARQVTRLMEVFDQTTKPKTEIRVKLAEELEMHPRAVQIWFQNRRQKLKKGSHETNVFDSLNSIEATKLTLSHPNSFVHTQLSASSYKSDFEYSNLISPTTTSSTSFDIKNDPNPYEHKLDEFTNANALLYSVRIPSFDETPNAVSHDSLTLLHTCNTAALQITHDPVPLFTTITETPNMAPVSYPEGLDETAALQPGLGSLGLDLTTQIDLLQQQTLNPSYGNKKKTPTTTEEFNWTNCNMPLNTTKMDAMKNRANLKFRSKSFQHRDEYVESDADASPWNYVSRSATAEFQLKQPPLKKRRHTTSVFEFSY